jgi:non-heme chloroperoxidase
MFRTDAASRLCAGGLTAQLVKNAKLIVYEGGSHGLIITQKDKLNADLLAFLKS